MAFLTDLRWVNGTWVDYFTNDTIYGTPGDDQVTLGAGNDFFNDIDGGHDVVTDVGRNGFRSGNDVISTGVGNDGVITDLDGPNSYYGGLGADTLNVRPSASGVLVNLVYNFAQNNGFGVASTVVGFENVNGSIFADTIWGDSWANNIYGAEGDDYIDGGTSGDLLFGMDGNDRVFGGNDYDTAFGGAGEDQVYGGSGGDRLYGGDGNDRVAGGDGHDEVYGDDNNTVTSGNDTMFGDAGMDHMIGGLGNDLIFGGADNDYIEGGDGVDQIEGMGGFDRMMGGAGIDRFVFRALSDSTAAAPDVISDFAHLVDKLNVSVIDARPTVAGDQAFSFIGAQNFTAAGQVRAAYSTLAGATIVSFNTDTDSTAEMVIHLTGNVGLTAADFVL